MSSSDFRAKRLRVNKIISSGSSPVNRPHFALYHSSAASNFAGGTLAGLFDNVGKDVYSFFSGSSNSKGKANKGVTLFGGDVVVSGTLYADKQIIEVDESVTGSLSVSGSLFVSSSATISNGLTVKSDPSVGGTISGSIHVTDAGLPYIVGVGNSISVASASNGQITITSNVTDAGFTRNSGNTRVYLTNNNDKLNIGGGDSDPGGKVEINVADSENIDGLFIDFNETGSKTALEIDSESTSGIALKSQGFKAGYFKQDISNGYAGYFTRNLSETGNEPLVHILDDNTTNTQPALQVRQDGSGDILRLKDGNLVVFRVNESGRVELAGNASPGMPGVALVADLVIGSGADNSPKTIMFNTDTGTSSSIAFQEEGGATAAAIVFEASGHASGKKDTLVLVQSGSGEGVRIKLESGGSTYSNFELRGTNKGPQQLFFSESASGDGTAIDPRDYTDTNFWVSGSIGNKNSSNHRGTAVFAGDVVISGSLSDANGNPISGGGGAADLGWTSPAAGAIQTTGSLAVTSSLYVGSDITHVDDVDTKISFTNDAIDIRAGNRSFIKITESGTDQIDFNENEGSNFNFVVRNSSGRVIDANDTGVVINEAGMPASDFRVESNQKSHAIFLEADNQYLQFLVNGASPTNPDTALFVSGTIGGKNSTSHRGVSAFGGDLVTSGALYVSGTIKDVNNSTNYLQFQANDHSNSVRLVAGNKQIISRDAAGTPDAIIINADQAALAALWRVNSKMAFGSLATTNQVFINADTAQEGGFDTSFWVSGSVGSKGTSDRGTSVFGGDLVASGTIYASEYIRHDGDNDTFIRLRDNQIQLAAGNTNIFNFASAENTISLNGDNAAVNTIINTANKLAFAVNNATNQVLILSGGAATSFNEATAADVSFYVSGSVASRGTSVRGASVFGGDLHISGNLTVGGSSPGGGGGSPGGINTQVQFNDAGSFGGDGALTFNKITNTLSALNISGSISTLGDGKSLLVAGSGISIVTGSNGQITITNDGTVGDITAVTAGTGIVGGGTSGPVTLAINNSVVATLSGSQFSGNVGITGSLGVENTSFLNGDVNLGSQSSDDIYFRGKVDTEILPKTDNTYSLGGPSNRWANIYTGDLHLRNDKGDWTIQEESDMLIVINNKTGKKFRMVLAPLEEGE